MRNIIFINSHPIQYFAPMYKYMNEHDIKTQAWYCSDISVKGGLDKQFGVQVKWDVPLLDGYEHTFFKNYTWHPDITDSFFSAINWGMIYQLFKQPKSVIVVHGWHYLTHFLILMLGQFRGHTVCVRCDMPQNLEALKKGWKQRVKYFGLKYILFPRINYFLYIGTQNRLLYKRYDILDKRLVFCPYSVDNERFKKERLFLSDKRNDILKKLGIGPDEKVILYTGKYIAIKRPIDLLKAFSLLNDPDTWLIMVGEGDLRSEMETYIREHGLTRVILTGFVNQSLIAEYYSISDVLVMCTIGDNWGLSINEGMCFNLPVVVSDLTGCADDLIIPGVNGYVFETGNAADLAVKLRDILFGKTLTWEVSSEAIIDKYSYSEVVKNLNQLL